MTDTTPTERPSIVNMEKLQRELGRTPDDYGKRNFTQRSPLQQIALEIKKLTWDESIVLGTALAKHLDGAEAIKAITALQHAADELKDAE